jgi:hypothetical protein
VEVDVVVVDTVLIMGFPFLEATVFLC